MPKLQGFAWHIETMYNPNKVLKKKRKKKSRNSTAKFRLSSKDQTEKTNTIIVIDSKGTHKETRIVKMENGKSWKYYSHKKYGCLRHTRSIGNIMYFINKSRKMYKVNKKTFRKWENEGVIHEVSLNQTY